MTSRIPSDSLVTVILTRGVFDKLNIFYPRLVDKRLKSPCLSLFLSV